MLIEDDKKKFPGPPSLKFYGKTEELMRTRGVNSSHVVISHDEGLIFAVVLLEKN